MSPAAVVLVMPVATVAVPRDSDDPSVVPLTSSSSPDGDSVASDVPYPVPSLPLHHARSCFRVYRRANPPGGPSPQPLPPPTASDNEVSDLLRGGGVDVDIQLDLLQYRHRRHRHRLFDDYPPQFSVVGCDRGRWAADPVHYPVPWRCPPLPLKDHHVDRLDDDEEELVQSDDVTVRAAAAAAAASVMNAFHRPSLDFYKMQRTCFARVHNGAVRKAKVVRLKRYSADGSSSSSSSSFDQSSAVCSFRSLSLGREVASCGSAASSARRRPCRRSKSIVSGASGSSLVRAATGRHCRSTLL